MDRTLNAEQSLIGQYDEFTGPPGLGAKGPGSVFSLSVPFPPDMLYYPTPALSARSAKPGANSDKALTRGESPGVRSHAGLQHGATRVGSLPVRCRWVKYPAGVENDTPMGKPG